MERTKRLPTPNQQWQVDLLLASSRGLIVLGTVLLALNVGGNWLVRIDENYHPFLTPFESSVMSRSAVPPDSMAKYVETVEQQGKIDFGEAIRRVRAATVHSDDRRITVVENWLQYFCGQLYQPLSRIQNSDRLVHGRLANCSERSQILKDLCEAAGHPSRFCGLNGHVVLEVMQEGEWYTLDPDYGLEFSVPVRSLAHHDHAPLVRRTMASRGYPAALIDNYLQILQSSNDNVISAIGVPLSPRLFAMERACDWLVWIVPALLLLAGGSIRHPVRFPIRPLGRSWLTGLSR